MSEVNLVNGWYVDANNNRWDASVETEESAKTKSDSLIDCSWCKSCESCEYCELCESCVSCSLCSWCKSCVSCEYCKYCESCKYCKSCVSCESYKENPQRIISKHIGTRNDQTHVYWVGDNVQVVCGCFRGDLAKFRDAIVKKHSGTKHESEYLKFCDAVETYMEMSK